MEISSTLSKGVDQVLILGIGNPLRGDDGVGPYIAYLLREKNFPGLTIRCVQQLDIGLLEEIKVYQTILLIDSSFNGEGLVFRKVNAKGADTASSTHHMSPELFAELALKLYQLELNMYVCALSGKNFEMGEQLSQSIQKLVPQALEEILAFLTTEVDYA